MRTGPKSLQWFLTARFMPMLLMGALIVCTNPTGPANSIALAKQSSYKQSKRNQRKKAFIEKASKQSEDITVKAGQKRVKRTTLPPKLRRKIQAMEAKISEEQSNPEQINPSGEETHGKNREGTRAFSAGIPQKRQFQEMDVEAKIPSSKKRTGRKRFKRFRDDERERRRLEQEEREKALAEERNLMYRLAQQKLKEEKQKHIQAAKERAEAKSKGEASTSDSDYTSLGSESTSFEFFPDIPYP
eukprot:CAMPEP_0184490232 /NCGR_PEP_ID=MMETSP0113_2-20130426/17350_1 /TAXON_ID=91329 /ORGANISM="Norrisiella sphaerica, Strain BC52" /LENGTH=243 /DNA_ID=CAMNT_0026874019 /DNA_START=102 /DNA_END=829 /DNA_ORIENTATION=+